MQKKDYDNEQQFKRLKLLVWNHKFHVFKFNILETI